MFQLGRFRLDLINDGLFEDEADSFVQRGADRDRPAPTTRAKSRIKVGFNSLLVRSAERTIVVDPGTGDKPRDEIVRRYHMEWPRKFLPSLADLGVRCEDVDLVILTHLHWDHCGASTKLDEQMRLVPTFPRAHYVAQQRELEAARNGGDSYAADDFEPLVRSGQLDLVEGDATLTAGVSVRFTGGHSAGHQIVILEDAGAGRAVYLSDAVPTSAQISIDSTLSYDVDVARVKATKRELLREAALRRDLLMFVHAPRMRAGYFLQRGDGTYVLDAVDM
jgi:glyoxylase-like metal-dependent hydrolase (beta-lactamase superfamily II)